LVAIFTSFFAMPAILRRSRASNGERRPHAEGTEDTEEKKNGGLTRRARRTRRKRKRGRERKGGRREDDGDCKLLVSSHSALIS
jgi:hypothetical protein